MRISKEANTLERGDVGAETTFRIQANARAFSILSSNLYTDKITAVIRELSCNAWDSHVAAGKQGTPFDVHLPNALEPWFSVTDYGLGLSHAQVMDLYTTYFSSTKSDSNDYVGALGLGSKSPFAYTSGFDVVSTFNGVQNSYAMFINERGEPSVAHLGSQDTSAPNGVMVKLPVKSDDFHNFRRSAQQVFQWFPNKPVVCGNRDFSLPQIHRVREGKGWYFTDGNHYTNQAVALMGSVAYPIKRDQVNRRYERLLYQHLVVEFNIGELDVAASREELSYDPTTVGVLETRLDAVLRELQEQVSTDFAKCTTMWEAQCLLHNMVYGSYAMRELKQMLTAGGFPFTWQGKNISATEFSARELCDNTKASISKLRDSGRREAAKYFNTTKRVTFFRQDVNDTTSRVVAWQKDATAKGLAPEVYIISGEDADVNTVLTRLGNPPIALASGLPRNPRAAMKFKGRVWQGGRSTWGRSRKSDDWGSEKELTVGQGGLYVTTLNMDPQTPAGESLRMSDLVTSLSKLGILDNKTQIWGINKTNSRLIAEDGIWTEFTGWAKEQIISYLQGNQVLHRIKVAAESRQFFNEVGRDINRWQPFEKHTNSVGRMVREWVRVTQEHAQLVKAHKTEIDPSAVRTACAVAGVTADFKDPNMNHIIKMVGDVKRDYPLIRYAFNNGSEPLTDFVKYVEQVDAASNS
jgi:hypothetical protein